MAKIISTIQFKRNTFSNWQSKNPVLASGEPGYEIDTNKFKIGDGVTNWNTLSYQGGTSAPGATALVDLTDVVVTGPIVDNEVVAYDLSTLKWINQTPAEAGIAAASHTHTLSNISFTSIPTAADLNTYTTQGLYNQDANASAAAGTNYPAPYAGLLEVITPNSNFVYQRYTVYQAYATTYYRSKYTTTWSAWERLAESTDTTYIGTTAVALNRASAAQALTGITSIDGNAATATTLFDADFKRITNPVGGTYTTTTAGTVTGAIAVSLPVGAVNTMVRMTIKVYEFTTNESFEIICGGYIYGVGNTWANSPFAYIIADPDVDRRFTIRFGYTAAGKMVVYIGELASAWSTPHVFVTDVQLGYSGITSTWTSGWSIGFQSTAFENVTATITNPQIGFQASANTANSVVLRDGSGNFSAGAISATSVAVSAPGTATSTVRNITVSTAEPSGGIDGDVWLVYI